MNTAQDIMPEVYGPASPPACRRAEANPRPDRSAAGYIAEGFAVGFFSVVLLIVFLIFS